MRAVIPSPDVGYRPQSRLNISMAILRTQSSFFAISSESLAAFSRIAFGSLNLIGLYLYDDFENLEYTTARANNVIIAMGRAGECSEKIPEEKRKVPFGICLAFDFSFSFLILSTESLKCSGILMPFWHLGQIATGSSPIICLQ